MMNDNGTIALTDAAEEVNVKESFRTMETFWCGSTLMYCSATGYKIVDLKKRGMQEEVLYKIRQKHYEEKRKKEQKEKQKQITDIE